MLFSSDTSEEKWVGKFELWEKQTFRKFEYCTNNNEAIILSGGLIYIVDIFKRGISFISEYANIEDFIYIPERFVIILTDWLKLYEFDLHYMKITWESQRISWDWVSFNKYIKDTVLGRLNDLSKGGAEFEFNINTKKLIAEYNIIPQ